MIIQALLTLLLFFSEGYVKYATIALFLFMDLVLFTSLLTRKWFVEELLTFSALFCSGVFMLFYVFMKSALTTVFGIALMLLFLVIAMVDFLSKPFSQTNTNKFDRLQIPEAPAYYYDVEFDSQINSHPKRPEPVMHVKSDAKPSEVKNKLTARAVAYELEREAMQLKGAEKVMNDLQVYNTNKEILKETKVLQDAQKQMNIVNSTVKKAQAAKELKKEATEILKVQKQINEIKALKELENEAKSLKKAENQVKEIQFLNKQEKIVKQAKEIAKAQKQIDAMNKNTKKSLTKQVSQSKQTSKQVKPNKVKEIVRVKTVNVKEESFYFATEDGNKFHEPGCLAIKKVPKNKLILYTNKKDAMKKGLQPCSVCIPR
jgi:hypothetical protein